MKISTIFSLPLWWSLIQISAGAHGLQQLSEGFENSIKVSARIHNSKHFYNDTGKTSV